MEKINIMFSTIYLKTFLSIILSLVVTLVHSRVFPYLLSRNNFFLAIMIPSAILLITQTIATNLYLSLGLIGALSIVRYRTPVKSNYDLAYLFSLIGIGIISGVNPSYAIFLGILVGIIPLFFLLFNMLFPNFFKSDVRPQSHGRIEVVITLNSIDMRTMLQNPDKGSFIRMDSDNEKQIHNLVYSFDDINSANSFLDFHKDKISSSSVSNF